MSNVIKAASLALEQVMKTVKGARVYVEPGADIMPPAVFIGAPNITWGDYGEGPTNAVFPVFVIAPRDGRPLETLWDFMLRAAEAADTLTDAVVRRGDPTTIPVGAQELPAYELQVEVPL